MFSQEVFYDPDNGKMGLFGMLYVHCTIRIIMGLYMYVCRYIFMYLHVAVHSNMLLFRCVDMHTYIVVHVLNTLIPVGAKPALQQAATVSVVHKVSLPGLVRTYICTYVCVVPRPL